MTYLSEEAPVSLSDIVGIVGLFYVALLVAVVVVGSVIGGNLGDALPVLDTTYASNFTA